MSNVKTREYTIVRLNQDNLKDLARLHSEVYATSKEGYFLKKYNTVYTGVQNVGFIAYNRANQPVAYYGVIPCFIQHGSEVMLAAQSADTMTHPKHRYKGMFVELSNMAFDLCREVGIRLIFGFPNQNSYHGAVNKLGWKMTGSLDCFTIPVNSLPLQSFSQKFKLENLYSKYVDFVLKKKLTLLAGVKNSVLNDGFAGVHRSHDYLHYKTYSSSKVISINNSKIWISIRHNLQIGDMENVNETNFISVIDQLKILAKRLGLQQIQFHCSLGTNLHHLFAAAYKPTPSFPMLFQDFRTTIQSEKVKFTFADIDIF
jgi:hypothetical protein